MADTKTTPDELWEIVNSRKQAKPSRPWPRARTDAAPTGPATDAVLVDVLYQSLRESDSFVQPGMESARANLRAEMVSAAVPVAAGSATFRRSALPRASARLLFAAALILIISAAVASIVKTAMAEMSDLNSGPRIVRSNGTGMPFPIPSGPVPKPTFSTPPKPAPSSHSPKTTGETAPTKQSRGAQR